MPECELKYPKEWARLMKYGSCYVWHRNLTRFTYAGIREGIGRNKIYKNLHEVMSLIPTKDYFNHA